MMMPNELEKLRVYQLAQEIGEEVWEIAEKWSFDERKTLGIQLIRSADSIAANISEGMGRFSYSERINFLFYARGSLFESETWISKAASRELIPVDRFEYLMSRLKLLGKMLNRFIKVQKGLREAKKASTKS